MRATLRSLCHAAIVVFSLAALSASAFADDTWHWVRLEPSLRPNPVSWIVLQGETTVTLTERKLHAELSANVPSGEYEYVLDGDVQGTAIQATQTQPGTDAGARKFVGKIQRLRDRPWGFDRIVLTSVDDGFTVVQMMRSLPVEK
jgi:hypothetical protein